MTLVDKATGGRLPSAAISGTWSSLKNRSGWPYSVTVATDASGAAASTTNKVLPNSRGNGCSFRVASVALAGFALDAAASVLTAPTRSW
jgi:hypothetical protein